MSMDGFNQYNADLEETNTTVMLPSINGGLAPAFKTHELRKRAANDTVETEKTTWLPDVNGKWQLSETRQNITTREAKDRTTEERVSRLETSGSMHSNAEAMDSMVAVGATAISTILANLPGTGSVC